MNGPVLSVSPSLPWWNNIASYLVPVCHTADTSRFKDKVGDDPDAKKTFLILQDVFETLMDGRKRCKYDKAHEIKGKWPVQSCYLAFQEVYRQEREDRIKERREKYKKWYEESEEKWDSEYKEGDGTGTSDPPLEDDTGAMATVTSTVAQVRDATVLAFAWLWVHIANHTWEAWELGSVSGIFIGIGAALWGAYM